MSIDDEIASIVEELYTTAYDNGDFHTGSFSLETGRAKAAFKALLEREVNKARIEELKGNFNDIGDLHMERVGVPEVDNLTEAREQERAWFASRTNDRLKALSTPKGGEE